MKRLSIATGLLALDGFVLLYYAYAWGSPVYLTFALFSLVLAYGVGQENRLAIKVALVYISIEFFLALLTLIAGNLLSAVDAAISFFILHDLLGYVHEVYREEHPEEFKEESEGETEKAEASNPEGDNEGEGEQG